jgi:hypothetical protein
MANIKTTKTGTTIVGLTYKVQQILVESNDYILFYSIILCSIILYYYYSSSSPFVGWYCFGC